MCQYLFYFRGADCRQTDENGWFPILVAALYGHLEIMKWLDDECGAHEDIRRRTGASYSPLQQDRNGDSPLRMALYGGHFHVVQWLIRNGALSSPRDDADGGGIDDMVMRRDLGQSNWFWINDLIDLFNDRRLPILSWAQVAVTTHANFQLVLTSTSFTFHGQHQRGILEMVSDYVVGTQQQIRTLRQLTEVLPRFIDDVPFIVGVIKKIAIIFIVIPSFALFCCFVLHYIMVFFVVLQSAIMDFQYAKNIAYTIFENVKRIVFVTVWLLAALPPIYPY